MKSIIIKKTDRILNGQIDLPASKSISNRMLMIRALSGLDFPIGNLSGADDTLILQKMLNLVLHNPFRRGVVEVDAGNAGTVMRFLSAYLSLQPGRWMLTGSERMKQRPIGILVEALKSLGASIEYLAKPGYPPLLIEGRSLTGREVAIDPGVSSQFTTALLLIAPRLPGGLVLQLKGKAVSTPYSDMTIRLMQSAGAKIKQGKTHIQVMPGNYHPVNYTVESDWSAAAFWYEGAVLAEEADLVLSGLRADSLQGDVILPEIFQNFGIRTEFLPSGVRLTKTRKKIDGFFFNFTRFPDIAQAVIATCCGLGIRGRFEGVQSLRIKETDRLKAMRNEFEKMGVQISYQAGSDLVEAVEVLPRKGEFPLDPSVESYGDHRTAMSLAMLALRTNSMKIRNPDVVEKSYPDFWHHLRSMGFLIQ
ncbi:MAG TPA: 3-phosphoshikimate 1-carboxyvinyltransferase [Bacteroidales bacterium]|nr:3-phosphoshikimate 1-carboxyvinyltransferase [Bacteroidales bacterium]